jgi:DNA mismatch repair protein MSH2
MDSICAISLDGSLHACIASAQSTALIKVHHFSLGSLQMQDLQHSLEPILVHFSPSRVLLVQGKGNQGGSTALQVAVIQKICNSMEIECDILSSSASNSHVSSVKLEEHFSNAQSISLLQPEIQPALRAICNFYTDQCPLGQGSFQLEAFELTDFMALPQTTASSLGLFGKNPGTGSLFALLSKGCSGGSGERLLASMLRQPLLKADVLNERLDCVEFFVENAAVRNEIQHSVLRGLSDLGKCISKPISNLETVVKCYDVASKIPALIKVLALSNETRKRIFNAPLEELEQSLAPFLQMVQNTVDFEALARHEYLIKAEFAPALMQIHSKRSSLHQKIEQQYLLTAQNLGLEAGKKIKLEKSPQYSFHMRIGRSEGWALRESKSNSFVELATLKNGVLFCTQEMRNLTLEYESLASEYAQTQSAIVREVCQVTSTYIFLFAKLDHLIARIDVSCALASAALSSSIPWTRPLIGAKSLKIIDSRHPCIEGSVNFIPNSLVQSPLQKLFILTGPNMGGKSTFIRQIGLLSIMAQIGSFVPCGAGSEFPLFDRILTRIGANDHLEKGVSTFMLEMIESSHLISTATPKSLVIIDELGRGTSTQDGFGLAWSIAQELAEKIQCLTLFATHFHELTMLKEFVVPPGVGVGGSAGSSQQQVEGEAESVVENLFVDAQITDGEISFGYRVRKGVGQKSFGIDVAKLCGFPPLVLDIARDLASALG